MITQLLNTSLIASITEINAQNYTVESGAPAWVAMDMNPISFLLGSAIVFGAEIFFYFKCRNKEKLDKYQYIKGLGLLIWGSAIPYPLGPLLAIWGINTAIKGFLLRKKTEENNNWEEVK
jgi:hypothetical protein